MSWELCVPRGEAGDSGEESFDTEEFPGDEARRTPELSDLDSYAGVDELGPRSHEHGDDSETSLSGPDAAYSAGGGSGGGIGGVGQLGDNVVLGPVPDLARTEDVELHELDDQGGQKPTSTRTVPRPGASCSRSRQSSTSVGPRPRSLRRSHASPRWSTYWASHIAGIRSCRSRVPTARARPPG
jgi:hypothetical protein